MARPFFLSLCILFLSTLPAKAETQSFGLKLAAAAMKSAGADIRYNSEYRSLDYPWGDVPANQGVCADVVIRAYRELDIDLQKRVHEDMKADFDDYPSKKVWGLTKPDRNIDHRRVFNLQAFFERQGSSQPITLDNADYQPGDVISWMVPKAGGGVTPHIGVVTAVKTAAGEPMVVHHLSGEPLLENVLYEWPITGHYRYQVSVDKRDR